MHHLHIDLLVYECGGLRTNIICGGDSKTICRIYCYNNGCIKRGLPVDFSPTCTTVGDSECVIFELSFIYCIHDNYDYA